MEEPECKGQTRAAFKRQVMQSFRLELYRNLCSVQSESCAFNAIFWEDVCETLHVILGYAGKAAWDVHRHRIAPEIHDILMKQLQEDRLSVLAGSVQNLRLNQSGQVLASLRLGPDSKAEERCFDHVFNCTGPNQGTVSGSS